jgi:hypothetical protein
MTQSWTLSQIRLREEVALVVVLGILSIDALRMKTIMHVVSFLSEEDQI